MKWETVKLGEVCEQVRGVSYSKSDASETPKINFLPVLRANNIYDSNINFDKLVFVEENNIKAKQLLKKGDVLVATSSGSIEIVGKAASINKDIECGFGAFCKVLRPRNINHQYFSHFFKSEYYKRKIKGYAAGANINNLKNEHFDSLEIPLPPIEEQRKIARVLDKADELRRMRKTTIAKLDELLGATFIDMFGDPVTNPKGWEVEKLGNVGDLDRGKSKHRPRNAPELLGGVYPLVQTGDVSNAGNYLESYSQTYSELGLKQSKMWSVGTLCITIAANIAKTSILTFESCFPDSVVGFKSNNKCTTEFVQVWFSFLQKILEDSAPESAQKNINLKILKDLDIIMPDKDKQEEFSKIHRDVFIKQKQLEDSLTELDNLFNSLLQRAFKGELSFNEDFFKELETQEA